MILVTYLGNRLLTEAMKEDLRELLTEKSRGPGEEARLVLGRVKGGYFGKSITMKRRSILYDKDSDGKREAGSRYGTEEQINETIIFGGSI